MMINKKYLSLVGLLLLLATLGANSLPLHLDYHRYLDGEGHCALFLDYQVVYRNLLFLARDAGYFAELDVELSVSSADSLLYNRQIKDNIVITNRFDALSDTKSYINRLAFLLPPEGLNLQLKVQDPNSERSFFWQQHFAALPQESKLSDIELNSRVYADSSSVHTKFRRGNLVYEPNPMLIYNKSRLDYAHLYMEIYAPEEDIGSQYLINLSLESGGEYLIDEYIDEDIVKRQQAFSLKIPLADLPVGKYAGTLQLMLEEGSEEREFEFVLTEDIEQRLALFKNPDDEYSLMRYFLSSRLPANWQNLDAVAKERYINAFWQNMALSTQMSVEDIMDIVNERVQYANKHFGNIKAGWLTDMGRIYIRNGAPADIEKGSTDDDTRFVRKDWEIWKYSGASRGVYLFIDMQMNNNHRLIYVAGDELEVSNADWQRLMGASFDEALLRN